MSMTMAVVDRAALERALEQLRAARTENPDVQAAVATLERALNGSEGRKLLTTTEAADTLGYCLQVKVLSHMSSTRISAARGGKGSVAAYTPYVHEPFAPTHGCRYAMRLMRLCNMAAVRLA